MCDNNHRAIATPINVPAIRIVKVDSTSAHRLFIITMKPSTLLFCLAPTAALVAADPVPHAVAPSPSLQNGTPSRPLSDVQTTPEDVPQIQSETQQMLHLQVADTQAKPDTIAIPLLRRTAISLRTRRSSTELTKRSEGTLGQTPWIGMAIGLTCTTMAAVMLG